MKKLGAKPPDLTEKRISDPEQTIRLPQIPQCTLEELQLFYADDIAVVITARDTEECVPYL